MRDVLAKRMFFAGLDNACGGWFLCPREREVTGIEVLSSLQGSLYQRDSY